MVTSVTEDAGKGGFAILDYFRWTPRPQIPQSVFDKPPQCTGQPASATATAPAHCATCHSGGSTN